MWTTLLLLLVPAAVRALGRLWAARRLRLPVRSLHVGVGPAVVRRTTAAGVAWSVGLVPLPLLRVDAGAEGRAALALAGPVAVYLAGALLVAATVLVRGEDHETNVVEVTREWETTVAWRQCDGNTPSPDNLHGLVPGDQIVAVDERPTPDGESIRRALTWTPLRDGEMVLSIHRDGHPKIFCAYPAHFDLEVLGWGQTSPRPGVVLRMERTRVGLLRALARGLAFPAGPGSRLRWLWAVVVPRVELSLRDDEITNVPSLPPISWPFLLADLMGFFALFSLVPWPGLDGGELFLVACQALRREPPPWFADMFRSWLWGAAMAVAVTLVSVSVPMYVEDLLGLHPGRSDDRAWLEPFFHWRG